MAVKVVKEEYYTKEKKVYTNLKREIKIMEVSAAVSVKHLLTRFSRN